MQAQTASPQSVEIRHTETATPSFWPITLSVMARERIGPLELVPKPFLEPSSHVVERLSFDAEWLNVVEQRILSSIAAEGYSLKDNLSWLQPEVANAALEFFRQTSSALPSEPYIYSSQGGELVAEFTPTYGSLTCLISPKFILLFAARENDTIEKRLFPKEQGMEVVRDGVLSVTNFLHASSNGTMEATLQR